MQSYSTEASNKLYQIIKKLVNKHLKETNDINLVFLKQEFLKEIQLISKNQFEQENHYLKVMNIVDEEGFFKDEQFFTYVIKQLSVIDSSIKKMYA